jgi:hypothetical protein
MKATIETYQGRKVLRVFYDPVAKDWNERISAALAAYKLTSRQVLVIAEPAKGAKNGNETKSDE